MHFHSLEFSLWVLPWSMVGLVFILHCMLSSYVLLHPSLTYSHVGLLSAKWMQWFLTVLINCILTLENRGWQAKSQRPNPAHGSFANKKFIGTKPCPSVYLYSMDILHYTSRIVVASKTIWPTKPKILLSGSLHKKLANHL